MRARTQTGLSVFVAELSKMELKQLIKLPERKMIFFLIFGAAVLFFFATGIYSSKKFSEIKDREIKAMRYQIKGQKVVLPVYKDMLEKMEVDGPEVLTFPIKIRLSEDKIERIPIRFAEIARKCNLEAVSIIPDVMSLDRNSGCLLVNIFL